MRTSFHIPDDLLSEFDETWQAEGLDSRSRAAREAMQEYIEGHASLEDMEGDVLVVIAFDYEHEAAIEAIHDVQHQFQDVITATNHLHEGEWCLETPFCEGPGSRVRDLTYRLRDFDAVSRVKLHESASDSERLVVRDAETGFETRESSDRTERGRTSRLGFESRSEHSARSFVGLTSSCLRTVTHP